MANRSRRNGPSRSATSARGANSQPSGRTAGNSGPARSATARTGNSRSQPHVSRPSSAGRRRLERFSAPVLVTLHSLPRWLVPVLMAVVLFFGLVLSGSLAWLGAILLVVVGLFVLWLSALSWPILTGTGRVVRVVVVGAVFGVAVLKALGRF